MSSSGFQAMPGWYWPEDVPKTEDSQQRNSATGSQQGSPQASTSNEAPRSSQNNQSRRKYWRPRQCRICLETVNPTYHTPSEHIPGVFHTRPHVTYESKDEGRLLRPCKCKGSSKYVHEGCLNAWRHADPRLGRRNYWQCPTCGFRYRLARLGWGKWIGSTAAQISLTIAILFMAVFILGFIADPIINLYLDPWSYLLPFSSTPRYYYDDEDDSPSWTVHFLKGFTSMGVVGFLKVILASPFSYFRFGGGRGRTTGRDRYEQVSWLIILIGVTTFLVAVWKGVRAWTARTLLKAGERVMDVQGDEDDDDEDEDT